MSLQPRSWPRALLTAVWAVGAAGTFVAGALGGAATGTGRAAWLTTGAVLAMVVVWLNGEERARGKAERSRAEQVAVDAQQELTLTLSGALAPLTSYLGALAAARGLQERLALTGQLTQAVVDAAVRLSSAESRSAVYRLDADGAALSLVAWSGRSDEPRGRFLAGTQDGDFVLGLVAADEYVLVEDVAEHPLVHPASTGYRTVVSVVVTAGTTPLGLLTVDAPTPGDLGESDRELLRVLANLLGAGLVQA